MSVPLDRLYNFLDGHCNHPLIIYRWTPHGSKKAEDCKPLKNTRDSQGYQAQASELIPLICHDQEPLCFSLYSMYQPIDEFLIDSIPYSVFKSFPYVLPALVYDKVLLLHSELNSDELEKFERDGAIGVYYWSHALISLDWFRYAAVDPTLKRPKTIQREFLIYNRAWVGTREYRLKFAELLVEHNLVDFCQTTFSANDNNIHYTDHCFSNNTLKISTDNLEEYFPNNTFCPKASADYTAEDYTSTLLEVVLETLFDDTRLHLTEKTLRPIACGQPFILAATAGSLAYLRSYGFKTFAGLINEDYDVIKDPAERLKCIVAELARISALSTAEKTDLQNKLQAIADYNRQLFFSTDFFNKIVGEFTENLNTAVELVEPWNTGKYFLRFANLIDRKKSKHFSEEDINRIENRLKSQCK